MTEVLEQQLIEPLQQQEQMLVEQQADEAGQQLPIYLLVLIGQTFSKEEKKLILERINSSKFNLNSLYISLNVHMPHFFQLNYYNYILRFSY